MFVYRYYQFIGTINAYIDMIYTIYHGEEEPSFIPVLSDHRRVGSGTVKVSVVDATRCKYAYVIL